MFRQSSDSGSPVQVTGNGGGGGTVDQGAAGSDPWLVTGTVEIDPTGLATSAKQDTGNTSLASIDAKLTNPLPVSGTVTTGGLTDTQLRATPVPVSGTVTATQGTGTNLHVVTDATSTTAVTQGTATNLKAQAESYQGGTAVGAANPLQVTLANTGANATAVKVDGSAATQPISGTVAVSGNVTVVQGTGTNLHTVIDSGTLTAVTSITNPLPAGTNVIGHVIADSGSTTAVTGNVTVVQGTGTNLHAVIDSGTTTVTQATGTNLHTVVDSGTLTAVTAITNALPAGSNVIGHVIADSGSTTVVTGNVTVIQGTATNLKTQAETYQGGVAVGAAAPLQVSLANTATNATAVKVDGSAVTQPVSGTVTATVSGTVTANQATSTTNSDPWYTEGSTSALSQNLNGQLRVVEDIQPVILDTLQQILMELRVQNTILHATLNSRDDLDLLRRDALPAVTVN